MLRVGPGADATLFYFVPALQPKPAKEVGAEAEKGAAPAKPKKKRKAEGAAAAGEDGLPASQPTSQRKRSKQAAAASQIDEDAPLSLLVAKKDTSPIELS